MENWEMFVKITVDGSKKTGYDDTIKLKRCARRKLIGYRKGELYHVYAGSDD